MFSSMMRSICLSSTGAERNGFVSIPFLAAHSAQSIRTPRPTMPPLSTQTYTCSILVITDSRYTCETDLRTIDAHMIIAFEIILHSSIIKLSVALIALMDLSF